MCEYRNDRDLRSPDFAAPIAETNAVRPDRRPIRVLLVGDAQDVLETIKNLHQRAPYSPIPTPTNHFSQIDSNITTNSFYVNYLGCF
jgi:hypothetical protein